MQLDVVVGFFLLGFFAKLTRSGLEFPPALYKSIVIFLLLAIGLKGGIALQTYATTSLVPQVLAVIAFGVIMPLIAFPILYWIGELSRDNAASLAAHYGSVSVGTYAVAIAYLQSQQISYEAYFPLFVVLLEMPAIAVGIWLAKSKGQQLQISKVMHEVVLNQGVVLLAGGLLIGWWAGDRTAGVMPLFTDLFQGVLALFLLEMGLVAASKLGSLRDYGSFIVSFAVMMPLVGAAIGTLLGNMIGLSMGGTILMATLGASASYIAVPAAMAVAVPAANQSLSITATLVVTFPFNVLVGIPLYTAIIKRFVN